MKSQMQDLQLRLTNENKNVLMLRPKKNVRQTKTKQIKQTLPIIRFFPYNNRGPNIKIKEERTGNETLRDAIKCRGLVVFIFCTKEETGEKNRAKKLHQVPHC